ncbi:MAG TPA: elongation factor P [Acidimicrobiia bacterium]|jgi:elongation factor P|nr:elongation factor P [Acidimicrobiia bacterium]
MASTNDVRPGQALDLEDGIFTILEYQHVKPGKGRAFVRMRLRNLETGQVLDRTFRAGEDVAQAIIDRREHTFLYRDDMGFHFMNLEDYGQFSMAPDEVGDAADFLIDGMNVTLALYKGNPISVDLPASVEMEVTYTEPGVRGDRVSAATKPATTQTGLVVAVPLFVSIGDKIRVDTRNGNYLTRV